MSLLICPECGHKVSEHANFCPECGCSIEYVKTHQKDENHVNENRINKENFNNSSYEVSGVTTYFLECISKKMLNSPLKNVNEAIIKECNQIKAFVIKNVFKNGRLHGQLRLDHEYGYTLFGTNINFWVKDERIRSCRVCYYYFKANKILEKIQEYEKIFGCMIITNHKLFLQQIYNDLSNNNSINFSSSEFLNSNFLLVPYSTLEDVINSFLLFEKK